MERLFIFILAVAFFGCSVELAGPTAKPIILDHDFGEDGEEGSDSVDAQGGELSEGDFSDFDLTEEEVDVREQDADDVICTAQVETDVLNCGACGYSCLEGNVSDAYCAGGVCVITACATGFGDCDADRANGCEHDTANDPDSCGGCGIVCSRFDPLKITCELGVCK